ncbi:hypothetical protein ACFYWX_14080 [Streptomyces sp. NPDC002888]|uniref:hypothetical protein n=1 Tax=Streptomyces sp. NPDC002888 TaxID=3364668 RepID=UPI0036B6D4D2
MRYTWVAVVVSLAAAVTAALSTGAAAAPARQGPHHQSRLGGANDRVSDPNSFWNARDSRSPEDGHHA